MTVSNTELARKLDEITKLVNDVRVEHGAELAVIHAQQRRLADAQVIANGRTTSIESRADRLESRNDRLDGSLETWRRLGAVSVGAAVLIGGVAAVVALLIN